MAANELVKLDGIIMTHLMRLGSGQFHFVFTATASRELRDMRREENNSEASSYAGITALKTFGQSEYVNPSQVGLMFIEAGKGEAEIGIRRQRGRL